MRFVLLDMVWPAIYVSETFWRFWFLVFGTIVIELFVIKYFLKYPWKKSIISSIVGNCVSGFIGTFIMMWGMLFWHLLADWLVPNGTFDIVNWVATYVLMCLGSVLLETITIKLIYKENIKRLFLPMLTGNFLSYAFIAWVIIAAQSKKSNIVRIETIKYMPNKEQFILLDGSTLRIDTCSINISFDKDNKRVTKAKTTEYVLEVPFKSQFEDRFQFDFQMLGYEYSGGYYKNTKRFSVSEVKDEYKVIMEQKNSDTLLGWTSPVITDTISFRRITK